MNFVYIDYAFRFCHTIRIDIKAIFFRFGIFAFLGALKLKSKFLRALALNLQFRAHLSDAANEIGKLFFKNFFLFLLLKLLRRNGIDMRQVHVVKYQ